MPSFFAITPERMISRPRQFDFDINAGRKIKLHQRVYGLRCRINDVEKALMRTDFPLVTRLFVDVRAAQN